MVATCPSVQVLQINISCSKVCIKLKEASIVNKLRFGFRPRSALICMLFLSFFFLTFKNLTPICYLPRLLYPYASFTLPCPPQGAPKGQTSLVVSSVDFLEPLEETEKLTSDSISGKGREAMTLSDTQLIGKAAKSATSCFFVRLISCLHACMHSSSTKKKSQSLLSRKHFEIKGKD